MSVNRLQTHGSVPSPVRGHKTPDVATPAGVKPAEIKAAQQVQAAVDPGLLDAFLQARAGQAPKQRGLVPSIMALLGAAPTTQPSGEAKALQAKLGEAVQSLGAIYQDGLVTEGELHHLQRAKGQLQSVLSLASPQVLSMLPKDVREKVQNNLLEPLKVLVDAAERRAGRVFSLVQARDEGALRERLTEAPTYRHLDIGALKAVNLTPFSLQRYQPGDFVAVPRSDGSVDKGVVVGTKDGELQVEVLDRRSGGLGLKSLKAQEVARANPLKVGDYVEAPGMKLWVTDVGPQGVIGRVQDARGNVRDVGPDVIAKLAVEASVAAALAPVKASTVRTSRQSLEAALDVVWADKDAFKSGQKSVYSDVYNAVAEANPLTVPKAQVLTAIADIAKSRPAGTTSNTQGFGGGGDAISSAVEMYKNGQLPAGEGRFSAGSFERTFFRFERQNWHPDQIKQRVYLNCAADHAHDVMRHVVQQIIDNPAKFPGVEMAKLSGPGAVSGRSENIVIYTHGDDASARVLDAVAQYRAQHQNHFMSGTPAFTEQMAPGVAIGDEPAIGGGGVSFGSLRADVIESALSKATDRASFGKLVDEGLKRVQVNPQQPHRNLQVARGLS